MLWAERAMKAADNDAGDLPPKSVTANPPITKPNFLTMMTASFGISRAVTVGVISFSCLTFPR